MEVEVDVTTVVVMEVRVERGRVTVGRVDVLLMVVVTVLVGTVPPIIVVVVRVAARTVTVLVKVVGEGFNNLLVR